MNETTQTCIAILGGFAIGGMILWALAWFEERSIDMAIRDLRRTKATREAERHAELVTALEEMRRSRQEAIDTLELETQTRRPMMPVLIALVVAGAILAKGHRR